MHRHIYRCFSAREKRLKLVITLLQCNRLLKMHTIQSLLGWVSMPLNVNEINQAALVFYWHCYVLLWFAACMRTWRTVCCLSVTSGTVPWRDSCWCDNSISTVTRRCSRSRTRMSLWNLWATHAVKQSWISSGKAKWHTRIHWR